MTYGDMAELVGAKGPRRVGTVMSEYGVRHGRGGASSAPVGTRPQGLEDEALAHWRAEGTPLVGGAFGAGRVDMARARWDGTAAGERVSGV